MTKYDRVTIAFHWGSAAAIIIMWPLGKVMVSGGEEPSSVLYAIHVGLGLVVGGATLIRGVWVLRHERPEELEMPRWEHLLFVANHYLLYILLIALAASGIGILIAAGGFDAAALAKSDGPQPQHQAASTIFLLMFVMHVAGVIYYQVTKGRTLRRMGVAID